VAVETEETESAGQVEIDFVKGVLYDGTAETQPIDTDPSMIDIQFEAGEVEIP